MLNTNIKVTGFDRTHGGRVQVSKGGEINNHIPNPACDLDNSNAHCDKF